ncbi:MAG TPA: addiction module protein [Pyrinomonadaceae bacterium]|jgi:putative addiction module component (TIGR02574 family)|nr:addiction module protein [Pyrinomonadaceae bacterium]
MFSQLPGLPPGFEQLSYEEQLDYVEQLFDYVTSNAKYVEIPAWHVQILEERMARYRAVGVEGRTWDEFEKELKKEFGQELT